MLRIFIYEFTTGGGLLALDHDAPLASLVAEGRAMLAALAADFAAIEHLEVLFLADRRLAAGQMGVGRALVVSNRDEANAAFDRLAADADWTVVIAPETDGHLVRYCRRVVELGGRLLGPPPELVALASDKQATAQHLAAAGVRVPRGMAWAMGPPWPSDFSYPAIWKPRDGAGSQGLCFVPDSVAIRKPVESDVTPLWDGLPRPSVAEDGLGRPSHAPGDGRLERYCPGLPVSVAVLCGPEGLTTLAPCHQWLTNDGCFRYLGGSLPMEHVLAERAKKLAAEAVASLHRPLGYLGVDLVLGAGASGDADFVIEINPRLTTSYVGLRAACESNLAEAMLAIAEGQAYAIHFRNEPLRFTAAGKVARMTPIDGRGEAYSHFLPWRRRCRIMRSDKEPLAPPGHFQFQGQCPEGKGTCWFLISKQSVLGHFRDSGNNNKAMEARLIPHVVASPSGVWADLKREDQEHALCYCGRPTGRFHDSTIEIPCPPGQVFAVFISPRRARDGQLKVTKWGWVEEDPVFRGAR